MPSRSATEYGTQAVVALDAMSEELETLPSPFDQEAARLRREVLELNQRIRDVHGEENV